MPSSVNALLTDLTAAIKLHRDSGNYQMAVLLDRAHEMLAAYAAAVIGHIGHTHTLQRQLEETRLRLEETIKALATMTTRTMEAERLLQQRPETFR